jgi:hypothetical protein
MALWRPAAEKAGITLVRSGETRAAVRAADQALDQSLDHAVARSRSAAQRIT